jgi:peptidoglycan/xylan/chitin deacetylase (PgdA/CDA1 family)/GT2 family glycosyltransferase
VDPEISVVIPTRGRPEHLRRCLDALRAQTESLDNFEVIVVVDGSDEETEEMLAALSLPFSFRALVQTHAGAGAARNRGAEAARGRFLLFLDDDIVADPTLVGAHLAVQRETEGVVGLGRIERALSGRAARWSRSRQLVWQRHYERLAGGREPRFTDCYGGNLSVPRHVFSEIGGFELDLFPEEDVELGYRLATAGTRIVYVSGAVAHEEDRDTLRHFLADARRRGVLSVTLYERHPGMLPQLGIGGAGQLGRHWVALRMLLTALRVPSLPLALVGMALGFERLTNQWAAFLYTHCYWQGVRGAVDRDTWRRLQRGAAILMYHAIGTQHERPSRYLLSVRRFKRQMQWLRFRSYNVIGLEELVTCFREHRLLPVKTIVITFDDGHADNADLALPVLRQLGLPATLFLVSGSSGTPIWECDPQVKDRPLLPLPEARRLLDWLSVGAHTRTHPRLPSLAPEEVQQEIAGSKTDLESVLEAPVTMFAYPYGETSPEVRTAVAKAGFLAACGVTQGLNRHVTDLYDLRRLEVRGTDSLLRFVLTLWLARRPSPPGRRLLRTRLARQ